MLSGVERMKVEKDLQLRPFPDIATRVPQKREWNILLGRLLSTGFALINPQTIQAKIYKETLSEACTDAAYKMQKAEWLPSKDLLFFAQKREQNLFCSILRNLF